MGITTATLTDKEFSTIFLFSGCVPLVLSQYDYGKGEFQSGNRPPASILLHKQALGQDGSFNYAFAADNGLQQGEVINPDGSRKGSYSYVDPNGKTVSLSYTAGKDGFRVVNGDHVPKSPEPQRQRPEHDYYRQQPPPSPHHYPAPRGGNPVPYEYYRTAVNAPAYRGHPSTHEQIRVNDHRPPVVPHHPLPPPQAPHAAGGYALRPEVPYAHPAPISHAGPAPSYQPRHYSVQEGTYEKPPQYSVQQHRPDLPYQQHHRPNMPYQQQQQQQQPHSFGNGFAFEFGGK